MSLNKEKNQEPKVILTMKNIVKEYKMGDETSVVLKGIDLEVREGEFLAVLGDMESAAVVALGVDRLVMKLLSADDITHVRCVD